jgi:hypothetical protein
MSMGRASNKKGHYSFSLALFSLAAFLALARAMAAATAAFFLS